MSRILSSVDADLDAVFGSRSTNKQSPYQRLSNTNGNGIGSATTGIENYHIPGNDENEFSMMQKARYLLNRQSTSNHSQSSKQNHRNPAFSTVTTPHLNHRNLNLNQPSHGHFESYQFGNHNQYAQSHSQTPPAPMSSSFPYANNPDQNPSQVKNTNHRVSFPYTNNPLPRAHLQQPSSSSYQTQTARASDSGRDSCTSPPRKTYPQQQIPSLSHYKELCDSDHSHVQLDESFLLSWSEDQQQIAELNRLVKKLTSQLTDFQQTKISLQNKISENDYLSQLVEGLEDERRKREDNDSLINRLTRQVERLQQTNNKLSDSIIHDQTDLQEQLASTQASLQASRAEVKQLRDEQEKDTLKRDNQQLSLQVVEELQAKYTETLTHTQQLRDRAGELTMSLQNEQQVSSALRAQLAKLETEYVPLQDLQKLQEQLEQERQERLEEKSKRVEAVNDNDRGRLNTVTTESPAEVNKEVPEEVHEELRVLKATHNELLVQHKTLRQAWSHAKHVHELKLQASASEHQALSSQLETLRIQHQASLTSLASHRSNHDSASSDRQQILKRLLSRCRTRTILKSWYKWHRSISMKLETELKTVMLAGQLAKENMDEDIKRMGQEAESTVQGCQVRNRELMEQVERLSTQNESLTSLHQSISSQHDALFVLYQNSLLANENLQNEKQQLQLELKQSQQELKHSQQEHLTISLQSQHTNHTLDENRSNLMNLQTALDQTRDQLLNLKLKNKTSAHENQSLQKILNQKELDFQKSLQETAAANVQLNELGDKFNKLLKSHEHQTQELNELQKENSRVNGEQANILRQASGAKHAKNELQHALDLAEQALSTSKAQIKDLHVQLNVKDDDILDFQKQIMDLQAGLMQSDNP